jgi:hypothetical protein
MLNRLANRVTKKITRYLAKIISFKFKKNKRQSRQQPKIFFQQAEVFVLNSSYKQIRDGLQGSFI